jgi:hypothetical protein
MNYQRKIQISGMQNKGIGRQLNEKLSQLKKKEKGF